MGKKSGRVEAWHIFLSVIYVILGIVIGIGLQIEVLDGIKLTSIAIVGTLVFAFSFITWSLTHYWLHRMSLKNEKEIAKKSIRKTFELLKTASRTLDNIDYKASTVLNSTPNNTLDKTLAHECIQNIRTQVVEIYNDVSICIDDWREILSEEFDSIEKKERQIDKLIIDQIIKTRKYHELERKPDTTDRELAIAKAELDRLVEKQRISRAEILSESKKLVGAPITTITDITTASYAAGKFEPVIKQPVYLSEKENTRQN